jgi:hypothetical protein
VRRKGKRVYLVPSSPDEVEAILRSCFGGVRPKFSSWVRVSSGGDALKGKTSARGRSTQMTSIGEGRMRVAFKDKHRGVPLGSSTGPVINPKLEICPDVLSVRCELVVEP